MLIKPSGRHGDGDCMLVMKGSHLRGSRMGFMHIKFAE